MIDIFDSIWELIDQKRKIEQETFVKDIRKNKNIFVVWKFSFVLGDNALDPDILHEIYLFKSYYQIISKNREHSIFKNKNALEFEFQIIESKNNSILTQRLNDLMKNDLNFHLKNESLDEDKQNNE
ncbi:hypothetical protein VO56_01275 [Mycoplasmopsis gallinacea]|uniref:Uncharacterized protein n=1 Tax=Mycoplasmopsis gallinacea TaxID=29556 RepID=A0A0D5ZJH7_9BACT|nr:hypothetical protein VO56_01275 [Mycoplasmopsis gallinacea]